MKVVKTAAEVQEFLLARPKSKEVVGFVPTMGALHGGHAALVRRARKECGVVVASIFVNPTQFNDKGDLARYPRTPDADLQLLHEVGCDLAFTPEVEEVYPTPDTRTFDFGRLDKVMEGLHRPGHFNGVAQVVSRLLDLVRPTRAYFGEKDFQQLAIVRELVRRLRYEVEVVPCPIVREPDGLALSSRNTLLTPEQRSAAPLIAKTLFEAADMVCTANLPTLKSFVLGRLDGHPLMQVEYFEVVNTKTLQPVASLDDEGGKQACIAVQLGQVRLIDNVRIA